MRREYFVVTPWVTTKQKGSEVRNRTGWNDRWFGEVWGSLEKNAAEKTQKSVGIEEENHNEKGKKNKVDCTLEKR